MWIKTILFVLERIEIKCSLAEWMLSSSSSSARWCACLSDWYVLFSRTLSQRIRPAIVEVSAIVDYTQVKQTLKTTTTKKAAFVDCLKHILPSLPLFVWQAIVSCLNAEEKTKLNGSGLEVSFFSAIAIVHRHFFAVRVLLFVENV